LRLHPPLFSEMFAAEEVRGLPLQARGNVECHQVFASVTTITHVKRLDFAFVSTRRSWVIDDGPGRGAKEDPLYVPRPVASLRCGRSRPGSTS
jgi:hypothetical protein